MLTNRTIPDIIKYIALKQSFKNAIYLTWSAKYKYFIWAADLGSLYLHERIYHKVVPYPNNIFNLNIFI